MKFLKIAFLVLVAIIAILLIVAVFVKKDFRAEASIEIDKPKQEVYDFVKMIENQEKFGVWFQLDPDMEIFKEGIDGTEGFVYRWESKEAGNGSQTITHLIDGELVEVDIYFGFGEPGKSYFMLDEINPNKTSVTWGVTGKTPYPFNLMSLFYDMNQDFETGLQNLKQILENQ